jgi:hypothetical protein
MRERERERERDRYDRVGDILRTGSVMIVFAPTILMTHLAPNSLSLFCTFFSHSIVAIITRQSQMDDDDMGWDMSMSER